MKINTYTPLLLAALTLVSCSTRDQIEGHARVTRLHQPAPAALPDPAPAPVEHIAAQQQPAPAAKPVPAAPAPVAEPLPPAPKPQPEMKKPEPPAVHHVAAQQQPAVSVKPVPSTPAPVAEPLPAPKPQSIYKAPTASPRSAQHVASQQQPRYTTPVRTQQYSSGGARLPIASPQWNTPQNNRNIRRSYPLMPGQNRGLKARGN